MNLFIYLLDNLSKFCFLPLLRTEKMGSHIKLVNNENKASYLKKRNSKLYKAVVVSTN